MARLITPIIDSAGLHRGSFRAGDFSQVRAIVLIHGNGGAGVERRGRRRASWKVRAGSLRVRLTRQRRRALSVSAVAS